VERQLREDEITVLEGSALVFDDSSAPLRPYLSLFLTGNYERIRQLSFGGV